MSSEHPHHKEYIEGLRQHDDSTIKQIYRNFFPIIRQFIRRNKGTKQDTQDVFQEVLLELYLLAKKPDFILKKSLNHLLYILCRNIWLKKLRKKGQNWVTIKDTMVHFDKNDDILKKLEVEAKYKLFLEKFQLLKINCQNLLKLYFEKKTMQEIADTLDFGTSHSAKTAKYKCVRKLMRLIEDDPRYSELS